MSYKIYGTLGQDSRILIVNESDWSLESNTQESAGAYEVTVSGGAKTIVARANDGESLGYGGVSPILAGGDRGLFAGGEYLDGSWYYSNMIEHITISTTGNASDFGDRTQEGLSAGCSNGAYDRGVFHTMGPYSNIMDYVTISTTGDASDFGDGTDEVAYMQGTDNGVNDRGIFAHGRNSGSTALNGIEYITISSIGDANDFGDLTAARRAMGACSNDTGNRGVFAGGYDSSGFNNIDYISINSAGDASDFGDTIYDYYGRAGTSNGTNNRGIFAGAGGYSNIIEYITITSLGDSTDFGDLTDGRYYMQGTSNKTNNRGVFGGGDVGTQTENNIIDYITISTTGDAADFGDLAQFRYGVGALSNS